MSSSTSFFKSKAYIWTLVVLFFGFNFLLTLFLPEDLVLDLNFLYAPDLVHQNLELMGVDGRTNYWRGILFLDMPYILVYSFLFCRILKTLWSGMQLYYLTLGIAIADFLENATMLIHINSFPEISTTLASISSFLTTAKWICVVLVFVLIIIGLLKRIVSTKKSETQIS